jgi:hypothetical protein
MRSVTTAPGAKLSATIARFCAALHRRRRSGPVMTSNLAIAPSLAPVQTPLLAPVLTSPTHRRYARRPSPEGYTPTAAASFQNARPPRRRLARSTFDVFGIVKRIVDAKAQFRSLAEPVGRHRHQHRNFDARRSRRPRRRGARTYPHAYRRRPQSGEKSACGSWAGHRD